MEETVTFFPLLVVEIPAADLRFTSEETTAFLTRTLGLHLSGEDIAALEARTEGWVAGLSLGRRDGGDTKGEV